MSRGSKMKIQISILRNQMDKFKNEYFKLNKVDSLESEPIIDPSDRRRVIFIMDYEHFNKIRHCIPGYRSLGVK